MSCRVVCQAFSCTSFSCISPKINDMSVFLMIYNRLTYNHLCILFPQNASKN